VKDLYIFPAVFSIDPDGISVEFPDLPGCFTCGKSEEEAIAMAKEAITLHLYGMEEDGDPIPEASKIVSLKLEPNQFVVMIEAWMVPFRDKMINKAVAVNTTVPKWLKSFADQKKVNYSHVLTEALKGYLGVSEPTPVIKSKNMDQIKRSILVGRE
jgi:Uncharacterized conserved protein